MCRAAADAEMVYHGFFDLISPLPLRGYVSEPVGKLRLARGLEGGLGMCICLLSMLLRRMVGQRGKEGVGIWL